jgi:hypothetical protein
MVLHSRRFSSAWVSMAAVRAATWLALAAPVQKPPPAQG